MVKQHSPRFLQLVAEAKSRIRECSVEEIRQRIDAGERLVLIDVREESEYAAGHAVGAIHLSKGVIERDIESKFPDPHTPLVLYCGGGYRSALAADNLQKMGYTNVVSLAGGWRAWVQAGLPVEHGSAPANLHG
ncbi:MAG: rhodanese-like domain-containing protein [Gemmataceae bacterium]|nr:rhodanese-like domain-containing protein [Gemmataceae bacterium]MCS7270687.1 rhodanese-like domain-containing protein [Gemmataceae bacterium]MDW8244672.1 rhodanese-like domain-containing protein [Thermogemmata sp.]